MRLMKSLVPVTLTLSGCLSGPAFMKQNGNAKMSTTPGEAKVTTDAAVVNDQDGVLTATLDPSTDQAQLVQASSGSAIAGSSINFPPGAIGVATEVTVEEGSSLASSSVASELGVADLSALSAASPAMVISSSTSTDAVQPFTVALAIGSSLALDDAAKELVVVYKVKKAEDGGTYVGVIPKDEIELKDGKAVFKTRHFGSYQAVYSTVQIAKVEKPTQAPIVTKREEQTQEQTPTTATEVSDLKVSKKGTTFVELAWKPAAVATGYVIKMVAGNKIDLGCRSGDFKEIKGQKTLVGRFDGLAANTDYAFRVCGALDGGGDSVGKTIVVTTAPLATSAVTDKFGIVADPRGHTATRVRLRVSPANGSPTAANLATMRFRAKFAPNSTTPPADCAGGETFSGTFIESPRIVTLPNIDVAYRICSVTTTSTGTEIIGSGVTGKAHTPPVNDLICTSTSGGSLSAGSTCNVNANFEVPLGYEIAGAGSLVIGPSATITVKNAQQLLAFDLGGKLKIETGGKIVVDGKGFLRNFNANSPGSGAAGGVLLSKGNLKHGTGGSNGGNGGFASSKGFPPVPERNLDFRMPFEFGSSGAQVSPMAAAMDSGNGGGAIFISAGQVVVNGEIDANGFAAVADSSNSNAGGAGGSVLIMTPDFSGTGYVRANGGSGTSYGGGGGGGRVSVISSSRTGSVTFEAFGGNSQSPCSDCAGSNGTVYLETGTSRLLSVTSNYASEHGPGYGAARTPINLNFVKLTDLEIGPNANAYLSGPLTTGATIDRVTIEANAAIDHSGMGFSGGQGGDALPTAGGGSTAQAAGAAGGGGGGNAGAGGASATSAAGSTGGLGNLSGPVTPGTGGGGGRATGAMGGRGGGVIRLDAVDFTVSSGGHVRANGMNGQFATNVNESVGYSGGGGGGGSIWIKAQTWTLPGGIAFEAFGGTAPMAESAGGGGGGGYIRLEGLTGGTGVCDARGGPGSHAGSAGAYFGCNSGL